MQNPPDELNLVFLPMYAKSFNQHKERKPSRFVLRTIPDDVSEPFLSLFPDL